MKITSGFQTPTATLILIVIFLALRVSAEIVCLFLQKPLVFAAVVCLFLQCRCCKAAENAFETLKWLAESVILIDWIDDFGRKSDFNKTFNYDSKNWSDKKKKKKEKKRKKKRSMKEKYKIYSKKKVKCFFWGGKWKWFWINNIQK